MVAYSKFIFFFQVSFFFLFYQLQLFSVDPTMFLEKIKNYFWPPQVEKPPSKVAQNSSNPFFLLTVLTAQTAQREEFMFQNVTY